MKPEIYSIKLRARHFKRTRFGSPCNCAISKAVRELFPASKVSEHIYTTRVDNERYMHGFYGLSQFLSDHKIAKERKFNDDVIRTIDFK